MSVSSTVITTPTMSPLWVPYPQNMVSMKIVPFPRFENCLSSTHVPGPLPPPPTLVQEYSFSAQTLPPIASQPDHSNPPPQAPTNHTPSSPSPNHLNSLCIVQCNSGGLSSSRRVELCSFLSSNRYNFLLLQEINLSSSTNFKVPGYSVFRADHTLTCRGPATAGNQNGGEFSL